MKPENKAKAMAFMDAFAAAHGTAVLKKKHKKRIIIPVKDARNSLNEILMDILSGLDAHGLKMYKAPRYNEKHRHYELSRHFTARLDKTPEGTDMAYILEFS